MHQRPYRKTTVHPETLKYQLLHHLRGYTEESFRIVYILNRVFAHTRRDIHTENIELFITQLFGNTSGSAAVVQQPGVLTRNEFTQNFVHYKVGLLFPALIVLGTVSSGPEIGGGE